MELAAKRSTLELLRSGGSPVTVETSQPRRKAFVVIGVNTAFSSRKCRAVIQCERHGCLKSDISRLEAKIKRIDAQLAAKDRELTTLIRKVCFSINSCLYSDSLEILFIYPDYQEAKNTAALKAWIDKLQ
ncbi:hypothetical protein ABZP36_033538 [Zizania latifolia]